MTSSRLEAFSDGILAIVITVMVIGLKVPETDTLRSLLTTVPGLLAYVLSFVYVAIYWNNHHNLMISITRVNGRILWINNFWLFFVSLIPWSTDWVSRFYTSTLPVMVYGVVLFFTAISYFMLQNQIIKYSDHSKIIKRIIGKDLKGKASTAIYIFSILITPFSVFLAELGYIVVAAIWFIPDNRFEKALGDK
ncbi:TMEM175 family protein [Streptococcus sp. CSL10205-OR2]|uniref:TMEM175 family protein n=1 Tax=Streptococcus sp. CSL10205-OR2 TaxID=2980558 RepID=UPI0021D911D8|nr:TMEM175 family protein [Streptococcus sp. CSL10205-OR2]MCU9534126.1 TMEM175 family protein [Streptococcus sp. CSL10205-OR2]